MAIVTGRSGSVWANAHPSDCWSAIVTQALESLGGTATLGELCSVIERHPRTREREHWKAKIRQRLQADDKFVRLRPGVWSFASGHSARTVAKARRLRRERYPVKPKPKRKA